MLDHSLLLHQLLSMLLYDIYLLVLFVLFLEKSQRLVQNTKVL